jgi:hypothetical protein
LSAKGKKAIIQERIENFSRVSSELLSPNERRDLEKGFSALRTFFPSEVLHQSFR